MPDVPGFDILEGASSRPLPGSAVQHADSRDRAGTALLQLLIRGFQRKFRLWIDNGLKIL
jgi:hypothetical protein